MIQDAENLLIGHNLDETIEVPGLIVVNKRNIAKENISWGELWPLPFGFKRSSRAPIKINWCSKYASITYNTNGKEFIDGGLNEAGLYIGEMNLLETQYPQNDDRPKIYHYQWMQYLLDNYDTVDQVIDSLDILTVDGHCTWHFFISDRSGQAAVIEFLGGKPVVFNIDDSALTLLCNSKYEAELEYAQTYQGFGGTEIVDLEDQSAETRFIRGATMLQQYMSDPSGSIIDFGFKILSNIKGNNNKWRLLFDVRRLRVHFYTNKASDIRFVDLNAFDLSPSTPTMVMDIHQDLSGDVAQHFVSFDPGNNSKYMVWNAIREPGFFGWINRVYTFPVIMRWMTRYANAFRPAPPSDA